MSGRRQRTPHSRRPQTTVHTVARSRVQRKPFIALNLVYKKGSISHHCRNNDGFPFLFYISLYCLKSLQHTHILLIMFNVNSNHLWLFMTVKVDACIEHLRKHKSKKDNIIPGRTRFQTSRVFSLLTKIKSHFTSLCFFFLFPFRLLLTSRGALNYFRGISRLCSVRTSDLQKL